MTAVGCALLVVLAYCCRQLIGPLPPAHRLSMPPASPRPSDPSMPAGTGSGRAPGPAPGAEPMPAPMVLELVAAVLAGGGSPSAAIRAVTDCLLAAADPAAEPLGRLATDRSDPGRATAAGPERGSDGDGYAALRDALELAEASGLGPVGLVRNAADRLRRERAAAQVRAARRLGVLILLPTGLCLLPAFVLLTVVPLLLDLVLR